MELFNMAKDPSEKTNLVDRDPSRVATLLSDLEIQIKNDNDSVVD